MTFEGFKDGQFHVLACFIRKKYLASKYTMFLNDTLYQSQEISPIFEMSQSESLHHFWWEFPPASLQEARPLFELPQVSPNGGGGPRPLLENVQKEAAFSSVWLPLVDQRFVINATELPHLFFLKTSLYLILWNYSTVSIFCWCVCVWECQQKPGMNFYYLSICFAEIVGQMELVDSKPLPKLHKWIC